MKKIVLITTVLLCTCSCSYIYIPNASNIPLIEQKGEAQASVLTGTSRLDFQGAYGLTDNIVVMANGSYSDHLRTTDSSALHQHTIAEIAGGYYKKIGGSGIFELYGGGGYGETNDYKIDVNYDPFYGNVHGKYTKFFIQPNIGSISDVFDGGLSLRVCYVNYFDFNYYGNNYKNQTSLFVEPVFTGKIGYKFFRFIMQVGFSIPVRQSKLVTFDPFILNLGLNFRLNTIKSKSII